MTTLTHTRIVTGSLFLNDERFRANPNTLGDGGQSEKQDPLFDCLPGSYLRRLIIAAPAADGIHLHSTHGKTTVLEGVHFRDVGEDAVTVWGDGGIVIIRNCIFEGAEDKVIQVNGTALVIIVNCTFRDFGTAIRSNGSGGDKPYRIQSIDCEFINGGIAMRVSNDLAIGWLLGCKFKDVRSRRKESGGGEIILR